MRIPSESLRTIQYHPEQTPPETQVYELVEAALTEGRRFARDHGETLRDHVRAQDGRFIAEAVAAALERLRDRSLLEAEDPAPAIAHALRRCPDDDAALREAGERMLGALSRARDALAAWRALKGGASARDAR